MTGSSFRIPFAVSSAMPAAYRLRRRRAEGPEARNEARIEARMEAGVADGPEAE